jgi:hypothetical protein
MVVPPSFAWKLVLAIVLGAGIFASAYARAPRRGLPHADLRRLVGSALALYAVGAIASLTHHPFVASLVYAAGIVVFALAVWLSRGSDSHDPPDGDQPEDKQPPPEPERSGGFDWAAFERQFRDYARRTGRSGREPAPLP